MSAERLHADCYQDGEYHILTMDIIFFGSIYMDAADFDAYTHVLSDMDEDAANKLNQSLFSTAMPISHPPVTI